MFLLSTIFLSMLMDTIFVWPTRSIKLPPNISSLSSSFELNEQSVTTNTNTLTEHDGRLDDLEESIGFFDVSMDNPAQDDGGLYKNSIDNHGLVFDASIEKFVPRSILSDTSLDSSAVLNTLDTPQGLIYDTSSSKWSTPKSRWRREFRVLSMFPAILLSTDLS